jgi:hypothetical protein
MRAELACRPSNIRMVKIATNQGIDELDIET